MLELLEKNAKNARKNARKMLENARKNA